MQELICEQWNQTESENVKYIYVRNCLFPLWNRNGLMQLWGKFKIKNSSSYSDSYMFKCVFKRCILMVKARLILNTEVKELSVW